MDAPRDLPDDTALTEQPTVAVILPCYNEGKTIARVVEDFRRYLPGAILYVYDNNSTDDTVGSGQSGGRRHPPGGNARKGLRRPARALPGRG